MKEKTHIGENDYPESSISQTVDMCILSLAAQHRLIRGSYCHQYGILIRLALFSGLRAPELLGLQWDDLDLNHCGLRVQHQYLSSNDGSGMRITQTSPRFVPIPAFLVHELTKWHEEQENTLAMYNLVKRSNSVAATLKGDQIPDWLLDYYFGQILRFCGMQSHAFSILRDTFAVNAISQGMDPEMVCNIMGESDTRYIYAKYKPYMPNTLPCLSEQPQSGYDIAYPVVVKDLAIGFIKLYAPNFPELTCTGHVLTHGLIIMRQKIEDTLRYGGNWPKPIPVTDIQCEADERIIQLCVNP